MTTCSAIASMPQSISLTHPVKEINRLSRLIMAGDYETPIHSLTKTLKNIKLILSGDAKIAMPTAPESIKRHNSKETTVIATDPSIERDAKEEETTPSTSPAAFEYDFYPTSSSDCGGSSPCFLETSVAVQGPIPIVHKRSVSVFQIPLVVKGDCFDVPLDSRVCEELSCVAIYNLALCHQLRAISLADFEVPSERHDLQTSKACLIKALSLYEYSHQIFQHQGMPVRMPALHFMALVGNLGQIHHLLGDSQRSGRCHKYLLSLLMYAIDSERVGKQELSARDRLAVDGFLAIVQHLAIPPEDRCTAVAA